MEFLLQLFTELVNGNENITETIDEMELVEMEENQAAENIFTMLHFH